jgi:NADPH-dependent 7-cyano-7-deazaguanine reductase QueF
VSGFPDWYNVQYDNDEVTYKGKVLCIVSGFPDWYNVQYENDEAIYVYNLIEDYKKGDLRIIVTSSEEDD